MSHEKLDEILNEIPSESSPFQEKAKFIYAVLQPHGLERSGAKRLSHVAGLVDFLRKEKLQMNPMQFPSLPIDTIHSYQIGTRACQVLEEYLKGYGLTIEHQYPAGDKKKPLTLAWPDYRALTFYCQEKSALSAAQAKTAVKEN